MATVMLDVGSLSAPPPLELAYQRADSRHYNQTTHLDENCPPPLHATWQSDEGSLQRYVPLPRCKISFGEINIWCLAECEMYYCSHTEKMCTIRRLAIANRSRVSIRGPISHRFREKRQFLSKSRISPTPVYLTSPLKEFPLEFCNERK